MIDTDNPKLDLAFDFVQYTGTNVFLTGKAGTGKTTFLHRLKELSPKRMIVIAPTGVAAINAGGVTAHSFFQLPFGPVIPGFRKGNGFGRKAAEEQPPRFRRFSREKKNIMRSLDLLVIDEISMVRADMLDGIDEVLRRHKNRSRPFGGVQLLMIGDMQQLAPVVKEDEWDILKGHYDTAFFFSSKALQQTSYVSIELEHVYRQSDDRFITLLNKIRDNQLGDQVIDALNARYDPHFSPEDEGYITLTTHNAKAKLMNESKLHGLPGEAVSFLANVDGDFPEHTFPADFELVLKREAQVMFVKNDPAGEKRYYNGKIGKVMGFDEGMVIVQCPGEEHPIAVEPVEWHNVKYSLDEHSKEIKETVEGRFSQIPLKLAWAITIHKSQGLTFEKAIIDAEAAFAFGQVYVALSRCRSLEGLVLSTPIDAGCIKSNSRILNFNAQVHCSQPGRDALEKSKKLFREEMLTDLFDFSRITARMYSILKTLRHNARSLPEGAVREISDILDAHRDKIVRVADKFRIQLRRLLSETEMESDGQLQERIRKASLYFSEQMEWLLEQLGPLSWETDNRQVQKALSDNLKILREETGRKLSCLRFCMHGFVMQDYLSHRAKAAIEGPDRKKKRRPEAPPEPLQERPDLYRILKKWRDEKARELALPVYMVLQLKTMREMAGQVPCTLQGLGKIKGFGKKKLDRFGEELLELLAGYREENDIRTEDARGE